MYRDIFIAAVFLTVCKQYDFIKQNCKMRRGCFSPALSDEEVITMKICGEYFKLECDEDIFANSHAHYLQSFQRVDDWSLFVRETANLWRIKVSIQKQKK